MRKAIVTIVIAAMCVAMCVGFTVSAAVAAPEAERVDAATGATPNYRTFLEEDLKDMPLVGGNYTCLKSQEPYTYFTQDWFGVELSYLLDVEVGLKDDTTGLKVYASDGYSVSVTLDELRNANPDGLVSLLGWKKGQEDTTVGPYEELDDTEGPFRLIVPQEKVGPHPTGTPNWNKAVKMVRAIEVQPTPPGIPAIDPESIPPDRVVVYGNILNRQTYTVRDLKSIKQTTAQYHWKDKDGFEGDAEFSGIPFPFFLNEVTGMLEGSTGATVVASDGWGKDFTTDEINMQYPGNLEMLLAWAEDGQNLKPETEGGDGPIRFIRPQEDPDDVNKGSWVKNIRVVQVDSDGNGGANGVAAPDESRVPTDRIIVCGNCDPHNIPSTWYFAEGYTGGGFETWLCIGNPNNWTTTVDIEYMIEGEENQTQQIEIDPMSRSTVNVNEEVGEGKNVSAMVEGYHGDSIVAERAMYWNDRAGGHAVSGVTSPSNSWYLAEGSTADGFETWVLLQNPGDETADVVVNYMNADGEQPGVAFPMKPHSRRTVNVADSLPGDQQVSTEVISNQQIIAERAVYFNDRKGGTCAAGVNQPGTEWYLAEGSTGGGFETWILIQNPNDTAANVAVNYMNADGEQPGPAFEMKPQSRESVFVGDALPDDMQVSSKVTSDENIVVERAMYWNDREGGHDETAVDFPKFMSVLAEGATAGGFESWILIQNPSPLDALVNITYLTGEGPVVQDPFWVLAGQRVSINEADTVGETYQVSAQVFASTPVAVERSVYWNDRTEGTCARGYLDW